MSCRAQRRVSARFRFVRPAQVDGRRLARDADFALLAPAAHAGVDRVVARRQLDEEHRSGVVDAEDLALRTADVDATGADLGAARDAQDAPARARAALG